MDRERLSTKIIGLAALMLLLSGCATTGHMTVVAGGTKVTAPAPGKALVVFLRTSSFGGAIMSTLYDGDQYIGTLPYNNHIVYQADPGKHMFMVIAESADFLRADLVAGKTYYAYVIPRPGALKARFSFRPQNGQIPQGEIDKALASTNQIAVNDEGRSWARENAASIQSKRNKYLPEWESKAEADKQTLRAESGR